MVKLELIGVGNGDDNYPGNFTLEEKIIIQNHIRGKSLNLFSGKCQIGDIKIDYKYGDYDMDVFEYLDDCLEFNLKFGTIIIDAPYNQRFANMYQKIGNTPKQFIIFANAKKTTELFNKIIKIGPDIIILKSWNYYCLRGYSVKKGYVCYAGGYRKSTFLIIMELIK